MGDVKQGPLTYGASEERDAQIGRLVLASLAAKEELDLTFIARMTHRLWFV